MTKVELSQKELSWLVDALITIQYKIKNRTYESVFTDNDGLLYDYPENKKHWEIKQKQSLNYIKKLRKKIYDLNVLEMQKLLK